LTHISSNRIPVDDLFASGFEKESLANQLEQGGQVEGITSFRCGTSLGKYYISREQFSTTIVGIPIVVKHTQKTLGT
jgi:hypothetical protein